VGCSVMHRLAVANVCSEGYLNSSYAVHRVHITYMGSWVCADAVSPGLCILHTFHTTSIARVPCMYCVCVASRVLQTCVTMSSQQHKAVTSPALTRRYRMQHTCTWAVRGMHLCTTDRDASSREACVCWHCWPGSSSDPSAAVTLVISHLNTVQIQTSTSEHP
jgi:hypothetical protein